MTSLGQDVYEATDPSVLPDLTITGPARRDDWPDPFVATVWFPTDHGEFGVDISRADANSRWKGDKIIFPGETTGRQ